MFLYSEMASLKEAISSSGKNQEIKVTRAHVQGMWWVLKLSLMLPYGHIHCHGTQLVNASKNMATFVTVLDTDGASGFNISFILWNYMA
jgi:hypothetical protein